MHIITAKSRKYLRDGLVLMENPQSANLKGRLPWKRVLEVARIFHFTLSHRYLETLPRTKATARLWEKAFDEVDRRPRYVLEIGTDTTDALLPLREYCETLDKTLSDLDSTFDDKQCTRILEEMIRELNKSLETIGTSSKKVREKIQMLIYATQRGSTYLQNERSSPSTQRGYFLTFLAEHPKWEKLGPASEDALNALRQVLSE